MRKIGVFICHCGTNISQTVDIEAVVKAVEQFEGVAVVKDHLHFCSAEGQNILKETIQLHGLNGVVLALCSPKLHEAAFRKAVKEVGLNPYLLEIANIREQVSWCTADRNTATRKAIDLIFMKVKKASRLVPLSEETLPITKRALVIGGGIAGMEAALRIASNGVPVVLVEKSPTIGGNMAKLDKTFPTLDCAACILTPKMLEVMDHPLIDVYCNSTVTKASGFVGNFSVAIHQKSGSVDPDTCTGCGKCTEKCPIGVVSAFEEGLAERRAIYKPFPQALPKAPFIDRDACLYFKSGKCQLCSKICPAGAINYEAEDKRMEVQVGAIIVATGFAPFDAEKYTEYGYGRYPDVVTGLQFERLVNPSGPTGGKLVRPSDGKVPGTIVFVHCTGSRDRYKGVPYCSKICCMATAKHATIARSKIPEAEIYSFYIDIRAGGKNYEEFIQRAAEEKIQFIKGRVAHIVKDGSQYIVKTENILLGKQVRLRADMVVLAVAVVPSENAISLAQTLGIEYDRHGFYNELHPKLNPVSTSRAGIFLAGTCAGPMDIPDAVSHAGASAVKALEVLSRDCIVKEPHTAWVNQLKCTGCFACRQVCYFGAIEQINVKGRELAQVNGAVCQGCGNCVSQCPGGALGLNNMTDEQIYAEIIGALYW